MALINSAENAGCPSKVASCVKSDGSVRPSFQLEVKICGMPMKIVKNEFKPSSHKSPGALQAIFFPQFFPAVWHEVSCSQAPTKRDSGTY